MLIKNLNERNSIRRRMRIIRKSLTISERYNESIKISIISFDFNIIYNSKKIAVFLPFDGEIETYPLISRLWENNKQVFLPIINSFNKKNYYLFVFFLILFCTEINIKY